MIDIGWILPLKVNIPSMSSCNEFALIEIAFSTWSYQLHGCHANKSKINFDLLSLRNIFE